MTDLMSRAARRSLPVVVLLILTAAAPRTGTSGSAAPAGAATTAGASSGAISGDQASARTAPPPAGAAPTLSAATDAADGARPLSEATAAVTGTAARTGATFAATGGAKPASTGSGGAAGAATTAGTASGANSGDRQAATGTAPAAGAAPAADAPARASSSAKRASSASAPAGAASAGTAPAGAATPAGPSASRPPATAGKPEGGDAAATAAAATAGVAPQGAAPAAAASPATSQPAAGSRPDGDALARTYLRTGTAATVVGGGVALVPFGHGHPLLRCAPLRACAVELEPGERVLATSCGDGERWLVQAAATGAGAATPILVVKPTACDLSTNLVVSTDRRIYELALDSPPCRGADSGEGAAYNPQLPYTGLIRFYYPDELVRRWEEQERAARDEAAARAAGRTPLAPGARLAHLNFDYRWDRARRWPWVPAEVFDDGEHTYLVLPPAAHLGELPILLGVEPGGGLALLAYHLEGSTLIADRVLERAVLVVGHGKPRDEQRLEIVNRGFDRRGGR